MFGKAVSHWSWGHVHNTDVRNQYEKHVEIFTEKKLVKDDGINDGRGVRTGRILTGIVHGVWQMPSASDKAVASNEPLPRYVCQSNLETERLPTIPEFVMFDSETTQKTFFDPVQLADSKCENDYDLQDANEDAGRTMTLSIRDDGTLVGPYRGINRPVMGNRSGRVPVGS